MRVLIVDTETSSADAATTELVEVAGVIYDCTLGATVDCFSTIVAASGNPAEHINGVPAGLVLDASAGSREAAMAVVCAMAKSCRYIVAHNAVFDRTVLVAELGSAKWVCTYTDVEWPKAPASGRLVDIALAHGVGVVRAHRAIEDCLTLAAAFGAVRALGVDLDEWITEAATATWSLVIAYVGHHNNHIAKAAQFRWDPAERHWVRRVRSQKAEEVRGQMAAHQIKVSVHAERPRDAGA